MDQKSSAAEGRRGTSFTTDISRMGSFLRVKKTLSKPKGSTNVLGEGGLRESVINRRALKGGKGKGINGESKKRQQKRRVFEGRPEKNGRLGGKELGYLGRGKEGKHIVLVN